MQIVEVLSWAALPLTFLFGPAFHFPHSSLILTLVLSRSSSTAALWICSVCSALALWILSITLARRLSISGSTTTCSATVGWPPGAVSSSAPPWIAIIATAWDLPGSSFSKSLMSSPWILPPFDPPWFLLFPPWLLPLSSQNAHLRHFL